MGVGEVFQSAAGGGGIQSGEGGGRGSGDVGAGVGRQQGEQVPAVGGQPLVGQAEHRGQSAPVVP